MSVLLVWSGLLHRVQLGVSLPSDGEYIIVANEITSLKTKE